MKAEIQTVQEYQKGDSAGWVADHLLTTAWDWVASVLPTVSQDPVASVNLLYGCYLSICVFASLESAVDRESSCKLQAGQHSQVLSEIWMQIPAKHLNPDLQQLVSQLSR